MSAARQGSGRRAGRRRRRTAQHRPTPGRGLTPCRRSRIANPPSYSRYEPVIAGYPGETIAPKTLAVPRRQGKSVVASLPIVLYIRERFPCHGRATTEMEKAKRKTMVWKLDGGAANLCFVRVAVFPRRQNGFNIPSLDEFPNKINPETT